MDIKTIKIKKGFVEENFHDYDEREILPLPEGHEFGKGYNFSLEVYDDLFVNLGMYDSLESLYNDMDSCDGYWDVTLSVTDDGKFYLDVSEPYDYDGNSRYNTFELTGELDELRLWVKDGLDFMTQE